MLWFTNVLHVGSTEFVVQDKNFRSSSHVRALIGRPLIQLGSTGTATSCHSSFRERRFTSSIRDVFLTHHFYR